MDFKYKIGDKVRITSLPTSIGYGEVDIGTIGNIVNVDEGDLDLTYEVRSESWGESFPATWWFGETNIEFVLLNREDVLEEIQKTKDKLDELHQLLETFD
jgi:hypothetical protein